MIPTRIAALAAIMIVSITYKVEATPTITCNQQGCSDWSRASQADKTDPGSNHRRSSRNRAYNAPIETVEGSIRFLPHPSGCPRIRFCGCGVAKKVWGKVITRGTYAQAAYWKRLPRAAAGPGMVAIFGNHHVAYIERMNANGNAVLYDPNSGGHKTRLWTRSIRGAIIVNPHGSTAMN